MRSGTGFVRRICVFLLTFLCLPAGVVFAQQTSESPTQQNSNPPAGLPPVQPAVTPQSDAAVSSAGKNDSGQNEKSIKDTEDDKTVIVKLGPGDLIEVGVYNVPELASKVRVSNSGDIYLPLIDYVHVEGLTQEEAQELIEKRLEDGGFVRSPHVSIFVDEAMSQGVTIIGEVGKPGIYPDIGDHKLYGVISQAGGFSQNASRKIAILRQNHTDPIRIDLPRNLADDMSGNVDIQPGDTITVPRAPIIYVVGDVGRPSGLLVDNGTMTVLQAIALAGGTNKTASLGGARILRKAPDGGVTETKVEIKKMLQAKVPDVTLQADDILFVPISGKKVMVARTFEASMAVATAMAIYTVHP